jgi:hypothetical protein
VRSHPSGGIRGCHPRTARLALGLGGAHRGWWGRQWEQPLPLLRPDLPIQLLVRLYIFLPGLLLRIPPSLPLSLSLSLVPLVHLRSRLRLLWSGRGWVWALLLQLLLLRQQLQLKLRLLQHQLLLLQLWPRAGPRWVGDWSVLGWGAPACPCLLSISVSSSVGCHCFRVVWYLRLWLGWGWPITVL